MLQSMGLQRVGHDLETKSSSSSGNKAGEYRGEFRKWN